MARHPYATEAVVEFLRTIDGETELDRISAAFVGQLRRRGFGDFSLRLGNDDAVVIDGRPFHGVSTYSQGWERHFCTRNYFETSPVFRLARVMDRPFNWFELLALPWISKPDKRVFEEAVEFDIGLGITVPSRTRHGESGVFTVTSNPREDPTADVIRSKGETAHLLGFAFFEVAGPLIEERQRRRGLGLSRGDGPLRARIGAHQARRRVTHPRASEGDRQRPRRDLGAPRFPFSLD
jgi:hypothetical protein